MRIVVAHSHLASFGGGERVTLELLRSLSQRHDVTLWTSRYQPEATYPELSTYPRRELTAAAWLTARPHADVVIAETFGANLLALRHPHTICYLHTLRSIYLRGGVRPDLVLRRSADRAAIRRAAAVLTNSAFTAAQAHQRYQRAVAVVPPGVDAHFFALPAAIGSYALYVGRLAPEKGLERLLAWSAELAMELRLVGDGSPEYAARLRSLAGPHVCFCGALTGDALLRAYAESRFLAFVPHEEEFGLAVLEAMAAAKPVIAAAEGGLPELIQEAQTGYLVRDQREFARAWQRLATDDALCLQFGQAARTRAQSYTWERFARYIEDVCEAIYPPHV